MNLFDKFCPVCKRKNDRDAILCVHCGTSLDSYPMNETGMTRTTDMTARVEERVGELLIDESVIPIGGIAVYLAGTSDPVYLSSGQEFVIGRKVGEEEVGDDFLDLAKWGGYQLGLSKRHAMVRRVDQGYEAMDLSSRNGSWLNDDQLIPEKPYPFASGSLFRLAKMRLLVVYRPILTTQQKM